MSSWNQFNDILNDHVGLIALIVGIIPLYILYIKKKNSIARSFCDEPARKIQIQKLRTFLEENRAQKFKKSYIRGLQYLLDGCTHFFGETFSVKSLDLSMRIAFIYPIFLSTIFWLITKKNVSGILWFFSDLEIHPLMQFIYILAILGMIAIAFFFYKKIIYFAHKCNRNTILIKYFTIILATTVAVGFVFCIIIFLSYSSISFYDNRFADLSFLMIYSLFGDGNVVLFAFATVFASVGTHAFFAVGAITIGIAFAFAAAGVATSSIFGGTGAAVASTLFGDASSFFVTAVVFISVGTGACALTWFYNKTYKVKTICKSLNPLSRKGENVPKRER